MPKEIYISTINKEIIEALKQDGVIVTQKLMKQIRTAEKNILIKHLKDGNRVYFNGFLSMQRKPSRMVVSTDISNPDSKRVTQYKNKTKLTPLSVLKNRVDEFITEEDFLTSQK